jgi:hypothetical protein
VKGDCDEPQFSANSEGRSRRRVVDGPDRHWVSCSCLDPIPWIHVRSTAVAPIAAWAWRELGIRPKHRVLDSFDLQNVHLADGASGRVAHALGEAVAEIFPVTDLIWRKPMANKGRGMVRQPATKFANLRKKMEKNKIVAKVVRKKK